MNVVVVLDPFGDLFGLIGRKRDFLAHHSAFLVHVHSYVVASVDYAIAAQNLAEIFRLVLDALGWLAVNRQIVVLVGQLSFGACKLDGLEMWKKQKLIFRFFCFTIPPAYDLLSSTRLL